MEALAAAQSALGKEIENIINLYNKDKPDKKLSKLDTAWQQFEANDDKFRKHDKAKDHQYILTDYYTKVKEAYEKTKSEIVNLIKYVTSASNAVNQRINTPKPTSKSETSTSSISTNYNDLAYKLIRRQNCNIKALDNTLLGINATEPHPKQYYQMKIDTIKQYWNQILSIHVDICEIRCKNI